VRCMKPRFTLQWWIRRTLSCRVSLLLKKKKKKKKKKKNQTNHCGVFWLTYHGEYALIKQCSLLFVKLSFISLFVLSPFFVCWGEVGGNRGFRTAGNASPSPP
jgi:hypothetical protein